MLVKMQYFIGILNIIIWVNNWLSYYKISLFRYEVCSMKLVCDLLLLRSISTSDTNSFSAEVLITEFIQQLNYNVKGQRLMDIGHQHALEIWKGWVRIINMEKMLKKLMNHWIIGFSPSLEESQKCSHV